MPSYKKATHECREMVQSILAEFETHRPTVDAGVKLDLLFAFPDFDETTGEPINDALKKNGVKALGITRIVNLKDRTKGLGDAEICLDGYWWERADESEQRALLDHELHHIVPTKKVDDLGRPKLKLRKHDVEFGWFATIAQRHGVHSQERKQAASMVEVYGQFFFPEIIRSTDGRMQRLEVKK